MKRGQDWASPDSSLLYLSPQLRYASTYPHLSPSGRIRKDKILASSQDSVRIAWVREYASQQAASWDEATAIATDASGNVYVTGSGTKLPFGTDYVTIKYDPSGRQLWLERYHNGGDDVASALAVDATGDVYVTGTSEQMSGGTEIATVKYSANGVQQWVARYSGPGSSSGQAAALMLDNSGNLVVAGTSGDDQLSYTTVVKYSSAGAQLWAATYSWPGNAFNWASAITLDPDGNICMAGGTQDSIARDYYPTNNDYLTIKYSQDGLRIWVKRYDGPRNEDDESVAIETDASGNVYVSGTSWLSGTDPNWSDWTTVKYSSSGVQLWARQYNGPDDSGDIAYALAVDAAGNVFVAGRSDGQRSFADFLTIKYDSGGVQQWVDRYDGPVNDYDEARAITLDPSGNVYVSGYSRSIGKEWYSDDYLTIKYSPGGARQWIARYNGTGNEYDDARAIAVDAAGNVYVTGSSDAPKENGDFATIKYNSSGLQQWVARYDGPGSSYEMATAFTIDASGNVYVAGICGVGTYGDYITVKYNYDGVFQWSARYNGPGDLCDWPHAITVDRSGNVYVTGESDGIDTRRDYATLKYDANGAQQWVARYSAPGNLPDAGMAVEVDLLGNVYVTGSAFYGTSGIDADFTTIKYDPEGREQWLARGPGTFYLDKSALALDAFGNMYIAGTGRPTTGRDYVLLKYTSSGSKMWEARYSEPANSRATFSAMAVDKSGMVYITGQVWTTDSYYDIVTIKYNPNGKELWRAQYDGPRNSEGLASSDFAQGLAVDAFGNVFVLADPFSIVKYDSKGTEKWVKRPGMEIDANPWGSGITVDVTGNIYATGYDYGSNEQLLVKYNSRGEELWVTQLSGSLDKGIFVDFAGDIYLAGTRSGAGWATLEILKLTQNPFGTNFTSAPTMLQNYPNPFNSSTSIRYSLPEACHVTLKLFNVLGQQVVTLVDSDHLAGVHEITWGRQALGSGVYFYRLVAGSFVETKKMILLR
jgi:uncharacterized delta-60 repeat protein